MGEQSRQRRGRPAEPAAGSEVKEETLFIHYVHDWNRLAPRVEPDEEAGAGQDDAEAASSGARRPPRVVYVNDWRDGG